MKLYVFDKSNSDIDLKTARNRLYDHVIKEFFGDARPEIEKNDHGKPLFLSPYENIHFNISHSGDLVVMAIGDAPVGVDVERIGRAKDYMKLAKRFFYDQEYERLLASENSEEEFYRIWTFREAFSKLVGVGLGLFSGQDIHIDYDANRVSYCHLKRSEESFLSGIHDYTFHEYPYPGYRITLCLPIHIPRPIPETFCQPEHPCQPDPPLSS